MLMLVLSPISKYSMPGTTAHVRIRPHRPCWPNGRSESLSLSLSPSPSPSLSPTAAKHLGGCAEYDLGERFDLKGPYVDNGWVDEDADFFKQIGRFFGRKGKKPDGDGDSNTKDSRRK